MHSIFVCIFYMYVSVCRFFFYVHVRLCVCVCAPQSRKGRSCSSQREVTVVLPNGQYVVVRCDIKSKARDVFDMVVAHANLVEHFYFGLAFLDGKRTLHGTQHILNAQKHFSENISSLTLLHHSWLDG